MDLLTRTVHQMLSIVAVTYHLLKIRNWFYVSQLQQKHTTTAVNKSVHLCVLCVWVCVSSKFVLLCIQRTINNNRTIRLHASTKCECVCVEWAWELNFGVDGWQSRPGAASAWKAAQFWGGVLQRSSLNKKYSKKEKIVYFLNCYESSYGLTGALIMCNFSTF